MGGTGLGKSSVVDVRWDDWGTFKPLVSGQLRDKWGVRGEPRFRTLNVPLLIMPHWTLGLQESRDHFLGISIS